MRETTLEDVEKIRAGIASGMTSAAVAKAVGVKPNVVSRVINEGWKPTGRKPVKLTKSQPSSFIDRRR